MWYVYTSMGFMLGVIFMGILYKILNKQILKEQKEMREEICKNCTLYRCRNCKYGIS